ncbi:MAG TPA: hypothetical protein DE312_03155 [Gallionella sp.]|nr:MAG: hypothetical protein A2Z87_04820 [Gallionellales bacterium GWA2_54_124]OGT20330.1 MAG: hypothetical protein A2522_09400 [Gallionellales bacterium RIFOXYD12_FULL_53_10]HCI52324.1 hypothetical protein [Gallionella sp.]
MNGYRNWIKTVSLRHRLLWSVLLPMLILLVINIAVVSKMGYDSATRRHDHFLQDVSAKLLEQLNVKQGNVGFSDRNVSILTEDKKDEVHYFFRGVQSNFRFGYADLPEPTEMLSEDPIYYFDTYRDKPVRMMAVIMPQADEHAEPVVMVVAKTLVLYHERAREWIWRVLPAHLILMGLSAVLVWWGVGRGLRPLLDLRDEITCRSSLDLHPLPEQQIIFEVRPLIHSFNELMARLDVSLNSQRRFITNAAHQLRTPLSGFKAQAELIMGMDNVDEIHYTMQQLHIAADQAGRMISQLLVLASSEPGAQTQESFSRLNLVGLARSITQSWVPRSLKRHIDLGLESDESDIVVTGSALLMGEMLGNLIDNALRYSHYSGRVTVRITRNEDKVYLEVEDNGPGIAVCERERIFERFYRVPGTLQDGCGLGLSIVREIAHRHRAEVYALSGSNGQGTLMRIVFEGQGVEAAV